MVEIFVTGHAAIAEARWLPSSSGLGHWPFKPVTRVQIPLGAHRFHWGIWGKESHGYTSGVQGKKFADAA